MCIQGTEEPIVRRTVALCPYDEDCLSEISTSGDNLTIECIVHDRGFIFTRYGKVTESRPAVDHNACAARLRETFCFFYGPDSSAWPQWADWAIYDLARRMSESAHA